MAEVPKSRLALDLEEIERQLRHSSQQPGSSRSDPLAELARIVGQDDPFRALLSNDRPAPRRSAPSEDIFARREPLFDDPHYEQDAFAAQGLRGSLDGNGGMPPAYQGHPAVALTAEEEALLRGQPDPRYSPAYQEPDLYFQEGRSYAEPEDSFAPVAPRSRKGVIAIGAVLGAAVIGVSGVLMLRSESLIGGNGEPPVVQADAGPSKLAPQNPGGLVIPNQNKQIYEGPAQDAQTRVVNREEQPIDVRQAARTAAATADPQVRMSPSVPPSASAVPLLQGTSNSAVGLLGEPRRVRTVSIRPDGTIIMPGQSASSSAAAAPAAMPRMEAPLASPPAASQAKPAPAPRPRDVTSTPIAPRAAEQTVGAPLQITSEAVRPKADTRVAAAPQQILREPAETSAALIKSPGFSVQLGVRNTEREGRALFEQLQQRFAGDLNGYSPFFRQAEINGKTAYRVRVGPMSRDDAVSLCSRLKASGAPCWVADN
jgi:hypothetical protein